MNRTRIKKYQLLTFVLALSLFSSNVFATSDSDVDVQFTIEKTLTISVDGSLEIDKLLPGGASKSASSTTVSVTTNSDGGYVLSATVGNSDNATTDLTNSTDSDASSSFSMIDANSSAISLSNFTGDTWGISIDGGSNFIGLPLYTSTAKTLKIDTSAAASSSLSVKLGAKATSTTESGTYSNVVNFAVVSQAFETLADITTMQEMTTGICLMTEISDTQYQLKDTRDNKLYYVAKLADGNCWMTQNLDLELSTTMTLTPDDSDVSSNWTPNRDTNSDMSESWTSDYYYTAHSYRPASDTENNTSTIITNGTTASGYKTEAECVSAGYSEENCAHWNVGTYYTWYTATAGTGNVASTFDSSIRADDSICPKGWRLPRGANSAAANEYAILATKAGGISYSTALTSPYYFLLSGTFVGGGSMRQSSVGVSGYYLSDFYYYSSNDAGNWSSIKILWVTTDESSIEKYGASYLPYTGGVLSSAYPVRCLAN